jgi:phosphoglycerate kinase
MALKQLKDLTLAKKRVLIRFDGDVPVEKGKITDDYRLKAVIPTVEYCLKQGAELILMGHRGRPDGKSDPELSNQIVADYFTDTLGQSVYFAKDFRHTLPKSQITVLENLRFNKGEEANDSRFAKQLASFGDVYVNDAFAVSHRAHASVVGVPKLLPHAAGFQLAEEVIQLTPLKDHADEPYIVVLGGAKASDKSPIIADLINRSDAIIIGGLVAVTYLAAMGKRVGTHKIETDEVTLARKIIRQAKEADVPIIIPIDFVNQKSESKKISEFAHSDTMLDIGSETIRLFAKEIDRANTLFWNGAMGKFEDPKFSKGTVEVGRAIKASDADIKIGSGGDTVGAIHQHKLETGFTYISTGGGATLEFIAGKELPGIEALEK